MAEPEVLTRPAYAVMSILMFAWFIGIDWTSDPVAILAQIAVSASYPIVVVLVLKLAYHDLRAGVERLRARGEPE